ncbi:hypothetical protein DOY81_009854 [Sarcophaga bullata]|nr:hypothetical protein DOY81_009854 [Sarcophaga bullata]
MKRFARLGRSYLKSFRGNGPIQKRCFSFTRTQTIPCLQLEWESANNKETIFNNLIGQQKRGYAPVTNTVNKECWNCKKEQQDESSVMLCQHCLAFTRCHYHRFDLELQALTKRFRQLQTIVHPDKFSNKSSREQTNSADWSSLINKAYKTLSIPIERGQYLLELQGLQIPQDNSALNKEFLMEMMERNEEVEEASTKNDLDEINERLNSELQTKVDDLTKVFASNDLEKAQSILVEMKYLLSIQKTVKNKLQTLMAS